MQLSDRVVQPACKGEVVPRDTREEAARSWKMVRRSQSSRGARNRISEAEVEERGDSPDGSDQINSGSFDSHERS